MELRLAQLRDDPVAWERLFTPEVLTPEQRWLKRQKARGKLRIKPGDKPDDPADREVGKPLPPTAGSEFSQLRFGCKAFPTIGRGVSGALPAVTAASPRTKLAPVTAAASRQQHQQQLHGQDEPQQQRLRLQEIERSARARTSAVLRWRSLRQWQASSLGGTGGDASSTPSRRRRARGFGTTLGQERALAGAVFGAAGRAQGSITLNGCNMSVGGGTVLQGRLLGGASRAAARGATHAAAGTVGYLGGRARERSSAHSSFDGGVPLPAPSARSIEHAAAAVRQCEVELSEILAEHQELVLAIAADMSCARNRREVAQYSRAVAERARRQQRRQSRRSSKHGADASIGSNDSAVAPLLAALRCARTLAVRVIAAATSSARASATHAGLIRDADAKERVRIRARRRGKERTLHGFDRETSKLNHATALARGIPVRPLAESESGSSSSSEEDDLDESRMQRTGDIAASSAGAACSSASRAMLELISSLDFVTCDSNIALLLGWVTSSGSTTSAAGSSSLNPLLLPPQTRHSILAQCAAASTEGGTECTEVKSNVDFAKLGGFDADLQAAEHDLVALVPPERLVVRAVTTPPETDLSAALRDDDISDALGQSLLDMSATADVQDADDEANTTLRLVHDGFTAHAAATRVLEEVATRRDEAVVALTASRVHVSRDLVAQGKISGAEVAEVYERDQRRLRQRLASLRRKTQLRLLRSVLEAIRTEVLPIRRKVRMFRAWRRARRFWRQERVLQTIVVAKRARRALQALNMLRAHSQRLNGADKLCGALHRWHRREQWFAVVNAIVLKPSPGERSRATNWQDVWDARTQGAPKAAAAAAGVACAAAMHAANEAASVTQYIAQDATGSRCAALLVALDDAAQLHESLRREVNARSMALNVLRKDTTIDARNVVDPLQAEEITLTILRGQLAEANRELTERQNEAQAYVRTRWQKRGVPRIALMAASAATLAASAAVEASVRASSAASSAKAAQVKEKCRSHETVRATQILPAPTSHVVVNEERTVKVAPANLMREKVSSAATAAAAAAMVASAAASKAAHASEIALSSATLVERSRAASKFTRVASSLLQELDMDVKQFGWAGADDMPQPSPPPPAPLQWCVQHCDVTMDAGDFRAEFSEVNENEWSRQMKAYPGAPKLPSRTKLLALPQGHPLRKKLDVSLPNYLLAVGSVDVRQLSLSEVRNALANCSNGSYEMTFGQPSASPVHESLPLAGSTLGVDLFSKHGITADKNVATEDPSRISGEGAQRLRWSVHRYTVSCQATALSRGSLAFAGVGAATWKHAVRGFQGAPELPSRTRIAALRPVAPGVPNPLGALVDLSVPTFLLSVGSDDMRDLPVRQVQTSFSRLLATATSHDQLTLVLGVPSATPADIPQPGAAPCLERRPSTAPAPKNARAKLHSARIKLEASRAFRIFVASPKAAKMAHTASVRASLKRSRSSRRIAPAELNEKYDLERERRKFMTMTSSFQEAQDDEEAKGAEESKEVDTPKRPDTAPGTMTRALMVDPKATAVLERHQSRMLASMQLSSTHWRVRTFDVPVPNGPLRAEFAEVSSSTWQSAMSTFESAPELPSSARLVALRAVEGGLPNPLSTVIDLRYPTFLMRVNGDDVSNFSFDSALEKLVSCNSVPRTLSFASVIATLQPPAANDE